MARGLIRHVAISPAERRRCPLPAAMTVGRQPRSAQTDLIQSHHFCRCHFPAALVTAPDNASNALGVPPPARSGSSSRVFAAGTDPGIAPRLPADAPIPHPRCPAATALPPVDRRRTAAISRCSSCSGKPFHRRIQRAIQRPARSSLSISAIARTPPAVGIRQGSRWPGWRGDQAPPPVCGAPARRRRR